MSNSHVALYRQQLGMCHSETSRVAGTVPENVRYRQLAEGKAHPLWLVGHLTNTINTVVIRWMLEDDQIIPKGFGRRFAPDFAGGNPITSNAADYPAWNEVVDLYDRSMKAAIDGLEKLTDDDLPQPLRGDVREQMRDFFSSNGKTLNIMVLHDSYHRGQIGMLSKLNA